MESLHPQYHISMEELETSIEQKYGLKIILLFLQKVEQLNERERATIIKAIELINTPMFVASPPHTM